MAEIARNESLKPFFNISQAIYSPNTLKAKMEPALQSIQAMIRTPAKVIEMDRNEEDDLSVVEVTASGSKTTSTSSITSPTLDNNKKNLATATNESSDDDSGDD